MGVADWIEECRVALAWIRERGQGGSREARGLLDELRLEELLLGHEREDAGCNQRRLVGHGKWRRWWDWVETDPEVGDAGGSGMGQTA